MRTGARAWKVTEEVAKHLGTLAQALRDRAALAGVVQGVARVGGVPVAGARVTLFVDSLATFIEARSGADGSYTFASVPNGSYRLGAALRGMEYQQVDVAVTAATLVRDFALTPETNPGRWDIVGNTLPEFFDATDIAILLPDGRAMFCHDTTDPIIFNPVDGTKFAAADSLAEQGCMNATLKGQTTAAVPSVPHPRNALVRHAVGPDTVTPSDAINCFRHCGYTLHVE